MDYNRSGDIDSEEEFIEIKSRFRQNESIGLILFNDSKKPCREELKVYDPQGRLFYESYSDWYKNEAGSILYNIKREKVGEDTATRIFPEGFYACLGFGKEWIDWTLKEFGEGEYSAVWRVNGKVMDSITFDILY